MSNRTVDRTSRAPLRTLSLGYLIALSLLLMSESTLARIEVRATLATLSDVAATVWRHIDPIAHLLSFTVLSFLALAARWPLPRVGVLGCLAAYAVGTEVLQRSIPQRTADLQDCLQNLAGIAVGATMLAVWNRCVRAFRGRRSSAAT